MEVSVTRCRYIPDRNILDGTDPTVFYINSLSSIERTFGARSQEERFVIERLYRRTAIEPINGREPDLSRIRNMTVTASEPKRQTAWPLIAG
jgi:hypothetical protein